MMTHVSSILIPPLCHFVWRAIPQRHWASPLLRRTKLLPAGTSIERFRLNTMITTQLHISLAWCQRMSRISNPIVEIPFIALPHQETTFFPSSRAFFFSDALSILKLESSSIPTLRQTLEPFIDGQSPGVQPVETRGRSSH
jgi:hypothetical protein